MAMIAYNKRLILETAEGGWGLDFTLSQPHETVNVFSGIGHFNDSPRTAWRTAFREALKLIQDPDGNTRTNPWYSEGPATSRERLYVWLTLGNGENGKWSKAGAKDAVDYYTSVNGDYEKLMLSFEWEWLDSYFDERYGQ